MILYHGSRKAGIKILKPFPHKAVDGKEVFFSEADLGSLQENVDNIIRNIIDKAK